MSYYNWRGFCLCGTEDIPPDAAAADAPFAPLVILVRRDPLTARGLYAIERPEELSEQPGPASLLPCTAAAPELPEAAAALVRAHGATVLNTAFRNAFSVLEAQLRRKKHGLRATLVGLGDVGGTVLTGLKLLGSELSEIAVFDPYAPMCARYELELNQVLPVSDGQPMSRVTVCPEERLFDCEVFLFTASRGVPPLGSEVKDVRMAQYAANREMLRQYAKKAREAGFRGLFCQISDPVDHLARAVFLYSNQDETGAYDFAGLLPEQIQGFGLGVMAARAAYMAEKTGLDFTNGRVYGPHGAGLIAANDYGAGYDAEVSERLTQQTREANLRVRELGFKPYIAPGLSSAAISVLRMLRGETYYSALPLGGCYFGCRSRWTHCGQQLLREAVCPALFDRLQQTHTALKEFRYV